MWAGSSRGWYVWVGLGTCGQDLGGMVCVGRV